MFIVQVLSVVFNHWLDIAHDLLFFHTLVDIFFLVFLVLALLSGEVLDLSLDHAELASELLVNLSKLQELLLKRISPFLKLVNFLQKIRLTGLKPSIFLQKHLVLAGKTCEFLL